MNANALALNGSIANGSIANGSVAAAGDVIIDVEPPALLAPPTVAFQLPGEGGGTGAPPSVASLAVTSRRGGGPGSVAGSARLEPLHRSTVPKQPVTISCSSLSGI